MSDNTYPSGQMSNAVEATRGRSPHWRILGMLAFAGLLCGYLIRYTGAPDTWSEFVDRAVVSLGFFILLFGLLFREITRIRKEKYANIQQDLHGIYHIVRDQLTVLNAMEEQDRVDLKLHAHVVQENLQGCLNRFASIFTLLTGTKCRASIKMIEPGQDPDKPVVYTYMRDEDSERFYGDEDNERRIRGLDLLEENTDFDFVFGENGKRWFFCNDLTARSNYKNSRDPNLKDRSLSGFRALANAFKKQDWNLPYCSGIVWPIRQRELKADLGTNFSFTGFLTIDSGHRNVFDERFDTHLGAGVADCFHHMLVKQEEVGATSKQGGTYGTN